MFKKWKGWLTGRAWGWLALLILCAVLPYANTLLNGFVYDDNTQILDNPYVRSFRYLPQIFGSSVFSFTGVPSRYYRPMMTFGYLLCYKVFGFSPAVYHLVNVSFHVVVVCLLFFLIYRMCGDRMVAVGTAALFALHPIHTESVAWIAAVTDLELTLFYLLTFWFFLCLEGKSGIRLGLVYAAMAVSFALALLSKEQAITLPILATIYEHFYREDRRETSWRRKLLRHSPLWVLAASYLPLRMHSLGGFAVTSNYWDMTSRQVLLTALSLLGQYVGKLFWPVNLNAFYVFERSRSVFELPVLAGAVCGVLLCGAFWLLWKRARVESFGLVWLIVPLLPVLNAKWLGANVFAERYLYLPSVGFCWVMAWSLQRLWMAVPEPGAARRRILAGGLIVIGLLCCARIVTRNRDWHDDIALYTQTMQVSPKANLVQANLAAAYEAQGLLQEAEVQYRIALDHDPDCVKCLNSLAWILIDQGRYADAKPLLARAVMLDPKIVATHLNQGIIEQKEGRMDRAEEEFRVAAGLAPRNLYVHTTLAAFYNQLGDHAQAEAAFKRALAINPYNVQVRMSLAGLYEREERRAEALQEFQFVLQNDPGNVEAITGIRRLDPQNH